MRARAARLSDFAVAGCIGRVGLRCRPAQTWQAPRAGVMIHCHGPD